VRQAHRLGRRGPIASHLHAQVSLSPRSRSRRGLLLTGTAIASLAHGCAHVPWADDPSAEPSRVCSGIQSRAVHGRAPEPESAVGRAQELYCLRLYAPAAAVLTEQVLGKQEAAATGADGTASPDPAPLAADRALALRWLVYIHRRFPGWERIVDVVGEAAREDLDRPELADLRDDLQLLAGRFEYRRERFDDALALLQTIPASSPLRAQAALFEGALHVRTGASNLALAAFAEALHAAPMGRDPRRVVRAGGALPPPLGAEEALLLLADVPVARRFDEVQELSREEAAVDALGEAWEGTHGPAAVLELTARREAAAREAGDLFRRRLQSLTDRLAEQLRESIRVEYEALQIERAAVDRSPLYRKSKP